MQWFYTNAGKQAGPVGEENFARLVREGTIQPTTLVWHEGMADWEPYSNVAPHSFPAAQSPPGQVACRECGRLVSAEDTLQIGGAAICAACKPTYLQKMREGLTTAAPSTFRYAGFWIRVLAAVIDGILLFAVSVSIAVMSGSTFLQSIGFDDSNWGTRDSVLFLVDMIIDTTYSVVLVTKYGGTFGKLACGIRVITADGNRLTYKHSLARALAQWVSTIPCGLGFVLAAFDGQKRALHDMMCNTRVIWVK
jgi:uncharacterized RDD family membrane protein YckC